MTAHVYFWARVRGNRVRPVSPVYRTAEAFERHGDVAGAQACRMPRATAARLGLVGQSVSNPPRRARGRLGSVSDADFAYRGYLVRHGIGGRITISKDGHHISYASSDADARRTIDMLTNPRRRRRPRRNAGQGVQFMFHGSFKRKADAVRKEAEVPGAFIQRKKTKQGWRYLVLTAKNTPGGKVAAATRSNPRGRFNPSGLRLIYPELEQMVARKGEGQHLNCDAACKRADHTYRHVFDSRPPIYGTRKAGPVWLPAKSIVVPA